MAVFGPCGSGDRPQGTARQRRLEQIGSVAGAGLTAGADQGVRLVDEQNGRRRRRLHFIDQRAKPLLELALHRSARLHQSNIQRTHPDAAQRWRYIASGDTLREAFDHGGLSNARFAGKDRIILTAPHQDVDDLPNFLVAAKNRVHFPALCLRRKVQRKAIKRGRAFRSGSISRTGRAGCAKPRAIHRA